MGAHNEGEAVDPNGGDIALGKNRNNLLEIINSDSTIDHAGRQSFNTVFGDIITVERLADIEEQFQYNISTKNLVMTTNGTGTVTQADNMAVISSGTDTDGEAELQSRKVIRYRPGFEGYAIFTALFENGGVNSSFQHVGAFTNEDGYFLGFTDTDFIVGRKINGVRTEVIESNFNGNALFTSLDKTKLNIFRITWGWLGTATITFECRLSTGWIVIHQMFTENILIQPHTSNPVLPISILIKKTVGTEDIIVKSASWNGGLNGIDTGVGDRYFTHSVEVTVDGTESKIFNLQNVLTFQSKPNRVTLELATISIASDGDKAIGIRLYKNLTINGTPSFVDKDSVNSIAQTDTAGLPVFDTSKLEQQFNVGQGDTLYESLKNEDFILNPGDIYSLSGEDFSGNSSQVNISVRWREKF